jgi:excisionase family DNA binding protein
MKQQSTRITVEEIAERLAVGERTVYELLLKGVIPATRFNQRWLIARHAYEQWEKTFQPTAKPELMRRLA